MPDSAPHDWRTRGRRRRQPRPCGGTSGNSRDAAWPTARRRRGWTAGRLFLQHGPINLVVRAGGPAPAVQDAYRALIGVFPDWLGALVEELPRLRSPESSRLAVPAGPIARRMVAAVRACAGGYVTPMAAVAGSVADEAAAVLSARPGVEHAYVNNGGDIALHLEPGARLSVGVVPTLRDAIPRARIEIASDSAVRGVATSGWQGRSHSLGIADAVTVLARSAALADAAATLVANAVDVDHPGIRREPAHALDEDSDLGDLAVTVAVPAMDVGAIDAALEAGAATARALKRPGRHRGRGLRVAGSLARVGDAGSGRAVTGGRSRSNRPVAGTRSRCTSETDPDMNAPDTVTGQPLRESGGTPPARLPCAPGAVVPAAPRAASAQRPGRHPSTARGDPSARAGAPVLRSRCRARAAPASRRHRRAVSPPVRAR